MASQIFKDKELLNEEEIFNKINSLPNKMMTESNLKEFNKYLFNDRSEIDRNEFIHKCQNKYDSFVSDELVKRLSQGNNTELVELQNYLKKSKELIIDLSKKLDGDMVLINPKCKDKKGYECWDEIKKTLESIDLNVKNIKIN